MKRFFMALGLLASFAAGLCGAEASEILTLPRSVTLALERNRTLEQAGADEEAARWQLAAAKRQQGPTVTWQGGARHIGGRYYEQYRKIHRALEQYPQLEAQYGSLKDNPEWENEFNNTISMAVPLYTGGKLGAQISSAKHGYDAAGLVTEQTRQDVRYQVAAYYYEALQRESLIAVHQQSVSMLEEHLRIVQANFEEGAVAMADVLASEVQLSNARQNLTSAENEYNIALARLKNLIGLPQSADITLDESLPARTEAETLEKCETYAKAHRADLAAAKLVVEQAKEEVRAARADRLPQVQAQVSKTLVGEEPFSHNHSNQEMWEAGVVASWSIFDSGVTTARVRRAQAAQKKAESQLAQTEEAVALDVSIAYNNLSSSAQNIKTTETAVAKAEEDYRIAQIRYMEGVDTNLSVMNAQEKMTEARTNYYNALYKYHASRAELERAMGIPVKSGQ